MIGMSAATAMKAMKFRVGLCQMLVSAVYSDKKQSYIEQDEQLGKSQEYDSKGRFPGR